ncbi:tRNA pseudouridine(38-40) synthase TruA [Halorubellus sp. JP-L1]|uniref:tRNA pseudouridine(38-40) synthase TruA n=1 Tax=Halorubellus sp. JP-L1 TaxID=2715753 RepID=UPI001408BC3B|nr:tRNA pseudouridine(38-40) synthase TruA [Halorubellus sp. JP-L1]NHN42043.1 tRNA pseudouridine(38-40) synthase TruA [Halorubellus sp. JP-L1]
MRAFRVAYDGRPYHGFQRQPDVPTVEDAILDALADLDVLASDASTDRARPVPRGYAAAGRTDAGVSALAQTVAFDCPDWLTPRAFNGRLPGSIRAWASTDVDEGFHATHDATSRAYDYHLYAPGADVDRAAAALACVEGTHDFADLTAASDRDTTRTVERATATRDGDLLRIHVRADGFLWELVRRLVSLVHAVAIGDRDLDAVSRTLDPGTIPDHERVGPAPPGPLVLRDVTYPGVTFERDPEAAESARAVFAAANETAVARAATTALLRDGVVEP